MWGGGGGGGGPCQSDKKTLTALFVCFFAFFLSPRLILQKFLKMVNFKEKYHFSRFRRGSKFFQAGWGWGGQLLSPYRNPNNLRFSRGSGPPGPSSLDPHLAAIYLVSQSAKWCDRLLACTCARFPATSLYVFSQAPQ